MADDQVFVGAVTAVPFDPDPADPFRVTGRFVIVVFKVIPFHNAVHHVGIVAMDHADDQSTGAGKLVQLDGGAVQVQRHAAGNIDRGLVGNAVDPFRQYNFPHTGSLGVGK